VQSLVTQTEQLLRVWEKLILLVGDQQTTGRYEARIEDFINGGIVITRPVFIQGQTLLRDSVSVLVQFTREDASYEFRSRIKRRDFNGRQQVLLTPPARIRRIQRRRFVRIESGTKAWYTEIAPMLEFEDWEDRLTWHDSYCVNLSAGGVLIRTEGKMEPGTRLLLRLEFFEDHQLPDIVAGVCRRREKRRGRWYAGVEYVLAGWMNQFFEEELIRRLPRSIHDFSVRRQNQLVAVVFREQVAMRQKGLL
jgi:c-di-GMP-binding flagellar brake protein YcgR